MSKRLKSFFNKVTQLLKIIRISDIAMQVILDPNLNEIVYDPTTDDIDVHMLSAITSNNRWGRNFTLPYQSLMQLPCFLTLL